MARSKKIHQDQQVLILDAPVTAPADNFSKAPTIKKVGSYEIVVSDSFVITTKYGSIDKVGVEITANSENYEKAIDALLTGYKKIRSTVKEILSASGFNPTDKLADRIAQSSLFLSQNKIKTTQSRLYEVIMVCEEMGIQGIPYFDILPATTWEKKGYKVKKDEKTFYTNKTKIYGERKLKDDELKNKDFLRKYEKIIDEETGTISISKKCSYDLFHAGQVEKREK